MEKTSFSPLGKEVEGTFTEEAGVLTNERISKGTCGRCGREKNSGKLGQWRGNKEYLGDKCPGADKWQGDHVSWKVTKVCRNMRLRSL